MIYAHCPFCGCRVQMKEGRLGIGINREDCPKCGAECVRVLKDMQFLWRSSDRRVAPYAIHEESEVEA